MKKNKFFVLFIILFISLWAGTIFAQGSPAGRALEIKYPALPQIPNPPTTVKTPLPEYVRYIYYLIIGVGGFFALGAFFYGGFRYITSAGNPEAMKDAKDQILAAVFGLLILFSSWIILYNINPELVALRVSPLAPVIPPQFSGVLLCKKDVGVADYFYKRQQAEDLVKQFQQATDPATQESLKTQIEAINKELDALYTEIQNECYWVGSKGNLPDQWDNKITSSGGVVYFIPTKYFVTEGGQTVEKIKTYAIVLFTDRDYEGEIEWDEAAHGTANPSSISVAIKDISSAIPMVVLTDRPGPDDAWKTITYEEVNYNRGVDNKQKQEFVCSSGNYQCGFSLSPSPRSLEIKNENKTVVVLTEGEEGGGIYKQGHVFITSQPNLLKYDRITCATWSICSCAIAERKRGGCPRATYIGIFYGEPY